MKCVLVWISCVSQFQNIHTHENTAQLHQYAWISDLEDYAKKTLKSIEAFDIINNDPKLKANIFSVSFTTKTQFNDILNRIDKIQAYSPNSSYTDVLKRKFSVLTDELALVAEKQYNVTILSIRKLLNYSDDVSRVFSIIIEKANHLQGTDRIQDVCYDLLKSSYLGTAKSTISEISTCVQNSSSSLDSFQPISDMFEEFFKDSCLRVLKGCGSSNKDKCFQGIIDGLGDDVNYMKSRNIFDQLLRVKLIVQKNDTLECLLKQVTIFFRDLKELMDTYLNC